MSAGAPTNETFGRRTYDVEITELRGQVIALQKENGDLRRELTEVLQELREDIRDIRSDNKELLDAWKSAKGMTAFVKWIAGLTVAAGIILTAMKGYKL